MFAAHNLEDGDGRQLNYVNKFSDITEMEGDIKS